MSDDFDDDDTVKKSPLKIAAGVLMLAVAMYAIWFSGAEAITRENITAQLTRFTNYVSKAAGERGREGRFNYNDLSIEGWGSNKYGVIHNVSLEVAEKTLLDTSKWSFSTLTVTILPNPNTFNGLSFVFENPINVIENGQLHTVVTGSSPIQYEFGERHENGSLVSLHRFNLPGQLIFTPGMVAGEGLQHGERTLVMYDEHPEFVKKYIPEKDESQLDYVFKNVRVVSGDGTEISARQIAGKYTHELLEQGRHHGNISWTAASLIFSKDNKTYTPYGIDIAMEYTGDQPSLNIKSLMPVLGAKTDAVLERAELSGVDFKLSLAGRLSTSPDDPLPYGQLNLVVENPENFLKSDLIPERARDAATAVLRKVTPQSLELQPRVSVPLKREKNGSFFIGTVTFEELTASLLKDAFKSATEPPLTLPPADEPSLPEINPPTIDEPSQETSPQESEPASPEISGDTSGTEDAAASPSQTDDLNGR